MLTENQLSELVDIFKSDQLKIAFSNFINYMRCLKKSGTANNMESASIADILIKAHNRFTIYDDSYNSVDIKGDLKYDNEIIEIKTFRTKMESIDGLSITEWIKFRNKLELQDYDTEKKKLYKSVPKYVLILNYQPLRRKLQIVLSKTDNCDFVIKSSCCDIINLIPVFNFEVDIFLCKPDNTIADYLKACKLEAIELTATLKEEINDEDLFLEYKQQAQHLVVRTCKFCGAKLGKGEKDNICKLCRKAKKHLVVNEEPPTIEEIQQWEIINNENKSTTSTT